MAIGTSLLLAATPGYCDERGWGCEPVLEATDNEGLAAAAGWLSEKPLQILGILVAAWIANRVLRKLIKRSGERMMDHADRLGDFMPNRFRRAAPTGRAEARGAAISTIARSVATSIVVVVAFGAVLSVLGVSLAALFASAGVLGVALGFGAQTLVRDVLAGWFIIVEDRYGVGDTIDAGAPAVGVVERVTLRSTRLRDITGTVWHVANGEILRVGNKSQNWSRALVDVVVTPQADIDRACELLEEVGEELFADPEWSERITGRPNVLGVHLMDPTGVTLRVICETEPASQFIVEREYRLRVLKSFERHGIPLASTVPIRPIAAPEGPPNG
ncbi:MAG: mechanosensitive ion channel family protein [Actinomycetota bacterium]|nr:mechanosensitive ion channel family protein [Actinomycetota bacterium]